MSQKPEILDGNRLVGAVRSLIESRRVCRMEIPDTKFSWITLILGIETVKDGRYLLIDKVAGFEKAFSQYRGQEITVEFLERDGVPCHFKTRFLSSQGTVIRVELPESIARMQKRRFYRVNARLGTELAFVLDGREEKANVRDYCMGGVAFFPGRHLGLSPGLQLGQVRLKIPQGQESIGFDISSGRILRMETDGDRKQICVLEFGEVSQAVQERLWRHIFEEQRAVLKKGNRP